MKKINLFFVRHGETYFNKFHKIQGWSDSLLTEKGQLQAIHTGKWIDGNVKLDRVYSSDLGRTKTTTQLILLENKNRESLSIIYSSQLREVFFGSFEGDKLNQLVDLFDIIIPVENDSELASYVDEDEMMNQVKKYDPIHDAEDAAEFWHRVKKGLADIWADSDDGDNILVVTHGALIRKLASRIENCYHENPDNGSISTFEMTDVADLTLQKYNQYL
ncbi:histidine phosphatase family protein [uncultured Leuconostoc sp.]|uniref:histidine phosphatase family protein n=1 Tax=uncultured Leuconostoc sp. TaxID=173262 RepID=UPI0025F4185F|nr:histidine phosphatase family protein [uncultured Leuconostoc sp.]